MDCKNIGPDLASLIDKELAVEHKQLVEEHLLFCDACSREKVRLERLKKNVRDANTPQLSDDFDANLLTAIKGMDAPKRPHILWPLAASFVLAVPLILMTYISKQQSSFVSNDLEVELQSVGRAPENQATFHQWTQVEENLLCANAASNGDCKQEPTVLVGINQG
jgi:anti-sigma factor RsiW